MTKDECRAATNEAIRNGTLQRRPCEVCGSAKAHAHHVDYTNPLDIKWLCRTHHIEEHRRLGTLGRPPRADEASKFRLEVRLTDEEKAHWTEAAERQGQTLSQWLREACEMAWARGSTR